MFFYILLQFLCMIATVTNRSSCFVGAFQLPLGNGASSTGNNHHRKLPNLQHQQRKHQQQVSSSSFLSSTASPNKITSEKPNGSTAMVPPVKVVNAAELVHGPAHTAALERARNGSTVVTSATSIANDENLRPNHLSAPASDDTLTSPSPPSPSPPSAKKSQVAVAESTDGLLALMDGCDANAENSDGDAFELTLVLFHAHYCKICQRATMQLVKAAKEYPSVRFAKVESRVFPEPSSDNLRSIGVSKFPFIQIFRNGDCVASFSTGPTHLFLRRIRETLDLCLERDEERWTGFTREFVSEIQENRDARERLRKTSLSP